MIPRRRAESDTIVDKDSDWMNQEDKCTTQTLPVVRREYYRWLRLRFVQRYIYSLPFRDHSLMAVASGRMFCLTP